MFFSDFDARSEASSVNGGQKATSIAGDVAEPEQRANSVGIGKALENSKHNKFHWTSYPCRFVEFF